MDALGFSCQGNTRLANGIQGTIVKSKSNIANNKTTGIKTQKDFWTLYPNPTAGTISLNFSGLTQDRITVKVVSMLGLEVYKETIHFQNAHSINLESFENGTYLLQVTAANGTFIKQVVKQ